jgi:hypothetical protein
MLTICPGPLRPHYKLQAYEQAAKDFDAAIRLRPTSSAPNEHLILRGMARVRAGDADGKRDIANARAANDDADWLAKWYRMN